MAVDRQQEILARLGDVQKRLELLSVPLEDVLASRVVEKSESQVWRWIRNWTIAAVLVILGVFGISLGQMTQTATQLVVQGSTPLIEQKIGKALDDRLNRRIAAANATIDQDLADLSAKLARAQQTATDLESLRKQLSVRLNDPGIARPAPAATPASKLSSAYAYYGQVSDKGKWVVRNFDRVPGDPGILPGPGDQVVARTDVNARSDRVAFDPVRGWIRAPIVGLIVRGERLLVEQIENVHDGFVWIRFRRVR